MTYFKDLNNQLHYLQDVQFATLLPVGSVQISDEEAASIRLAAIPEPTFAEIVESIRIALQNEIDVKARSYGFSGGNALMLYAGFVNPFQSLAQAFATWEASVWYEAEAYKAEVIAGTKPLVTGAEAVALMPEYPS